LSLFLLKSFTRTADGKKVEESKSSVIHVPPTLSGKCDHCLARGPLEFAFTFAFQPIVDLSRGQAFGYEVLGRVARVGGALGAIAPGPAALLDAAHAAGLSLYALTPDPAPGGDDDAHMAAALAALSRRPGGGKVVVFIGVDEAKRAAQPSRLLQDGTASRTYAFAESGDGAAKKLYTAGLEDGLWLLPGGADFDGLISAPAVLKEAAR